MSLGGFQCGFAGAGADALFGTGCVDKVGRIGGRGGAFIDSWLFTVTVRALYNRKIVNRSVYNIIKYIIRLYLEKK